MKNAVYTLAQASAVSGLPLKAIYKLIDAKLIRPLRKRTGRQMQRLLSQDQLVYLRLEAEGVRLLPLTMRREVAKAVRSSADMDFISLSRFPVLRICVEPTRLKVTEQLGRLEEVQEFVTSDPETLQGTPVFRGTRIPVRIVAEMLAEGVEVEEILSGYPALDQKKVELASLYVRAKKRPQKFFAQQRMP